MNSSYETLSARFLQANLAMEQVEVILSILIRLNNQNGESFQIPHEDVIVLLNTSIGIPPEQRNDNKIHKYC